MRQLSASLVLLSLSACVTTGQHEAALAELDKSKQELAGLQKQLDETTADRDQKGKELGDCTTQLSGTREEATQLASKVTDLGEESTTLQKELDELRRMRTAAEARNKEYRSVLEKLAKMIDSGRLEVKTRNGNMVVAMASDVLFPEGKVELKPEAIEALKELAKTIATLKGRRFQVVGHSDSTPISNEEFASNWELSSQRAIEVVRVMIEAGVPPGMVIAAGAAEFDPLAPNSSAKRKEKNRRIEVVLMPKIEELPGIDELLAKKEADKKK